ncbi:small RNA 2'-O-methyltransferase [Contarinia nasturtii]|uniref:small RNA 2'-O-methyltransferase n=1 Tax=Contarinia nasturtii TaxID=265458 RepID=UPI0012D47EFD|nr:small RNA 2'-O-methyltransferase [Contarinia nasturtii]
MESNEISEFQIDLTLSDIFRSLSYYVTDEDGVQQLRFDPPVYQSRYSVVTSILKKKEWIPHIKKVTEFGCADMNLVMLMRRIEHLTHILQIDIDEELLKRFEDRASPLAWDYLSRRKYPLVIDVYRGSVDSPHESLHSTDVVVCIEIIEHVYPETEQNLVQNIFGFINPKIAVFTTPNADFNTLFGRPKFSNGFRHEDHKFEWTQQQFKDWAHNICCRYPNYRFGLFGAGELPFEVADKSLGQCSQAAIFVRKDMLELLNEDTPDGIAPPLVVTDSEVVFPIEKFDYKLLFSKKFPYDEDDRSYEEKIIDDVHYFINRNLDTYLNEERNICEFPITEIFHCVRDVANIDELRTIIRAEFVVNENDCVEKALPENDDSEISDYDYDYDANKENDTNSLNGSVHFSEENWD